MSHPEYQGIRPPGTKAVQLFTDNELDTLRRATSNYAALELRVLLQLCEDGDPPINCPDFDYETKKCKDPGCGSFGDDDEQPCCGYCAGCKGCEDPCPVWRENSARNVLANIEDKRDEAECKAKRIAELKALEQPSFAQRVELRKLISEDTTAQAISNALNVTRLPLLLYQPQLIANPIKDFQELQNYFADLAGQTCYPNDINNRDSVFLALTVAFELGMTEVLNNPEKHGLPIKKKGGRR